MKQTAVEWLVEKFNQCEPMYSGIQSLEHKQYLDGLIEQANAMEKEQIVEAYRTGVEEDVYERPLRTGEQYYNETFKEEQ